MMYIPPIRPDEIYHYGMPERSGRYAWGSGDRPYQRLEGRASRMENRLRKRFTKANIKTSRLQNKVNKTFNKANRQRNSIFEFRREKASNTFNSAYKVEEKKRRVEYNMLKKYEKYFEIFENFEVTMDDDLIKLGKEYYERVRNNSNAQYAAALSKRVA